MSANLQSYVLADASRLRREQQQSLTFMLMIVVVSVLACPQNEVMGVDTLVSLDLLYDPPVCAAGQTRALQCVIVAT